MIRNGSPPRQKFGFFTGTALLLILIPGATPAQQTVDLVERTIPGTDVTFTTALIPGGSFLLGSPDDEPGRDPDEGPQRSVTLQSFWMTVHEVTQAEYGIFRRRRLDSSETADPGRLLDVDATSRPSPPYEDPAHGMGGRDYPATGMTQLATLRYARWLSMKTGRLFRLPTEAEWEYACKAGPDAGPGAGVVAGASDLDAAAWFDDNAGETTHPVGEKTANPWGLFDMKGNVAEWTLDQYQADFYLGLEDGVEGPWATPTALHPRTVRGGAFDDEASELRCSARLESTLAWKRRDPQIPKSVWWNTDSPHVGFRLVIPSVDLTLPEIEAYWEELLGPGS